MDTIGRFMKMGSIISTVFITLGRFLELMSFIGFFPLKRKLFCWAEAFIGGKESLKTPRRWTKVLALVFDFNASFAF